jgi:hypothetical protein
MADTRLYLLYGKLLCLPARLAGSPAMISLQIGRGKDASILAISLARCPRWLPPPFLPPPASPPELRPTRLVALEVEMSMALGELFIVRSHRFEPLADSNLSPIERALAPWARLARAACRPSQEGKAAALRDEIWQLFYERVRPTVPPGFNASVTVVVRRKLTSSVLLSAVVDGAPPAPWPWLQSSLEQSIIGCAPNPTADVQQCTVQVREPAHLPARARARAASRRADRRPHAPRPAAQVEELVLVGSSQRRLEARRAEAQKKPMEGSFAVHVPVELLTDDPNLNDRIVFAHGKAPRA